MSRRRWFGYRVFSPSPITDVFGLFTSEFSMDFTNMHDGDTIERALCFYRLETVLLDNSSGIEKPPFPWQVSFTFTPTPDGESEMDVRSPGGDALFRDAARWQPQAWTDGTLYATKWWATSDGMVSVKGGRKVNDKTTAKITLAAGVDGGSPGFDSGQFNYVDTMVEMWIEILVQTNF